MELVYEYMIGLIKLLMRTKASIIAIFGNN